MNDCSGAMVSWPDITPLSLGMETVGGVMTKFIHRGQAYPTRRSQSFSTSQDNQSSALIKVYEGERAMAKDNHLIGEVELTSIPPRPRGVPQISVTFELYNGVLEVTAENKETKRGATISIREWIYGEKRSIPTASDEDVASRIDHMVDEAERFAEIDGRAKAHAYAKNRLGGYL